MSNNPYQTITAKNPPAFDLSMSDDARITFGPPVAPGAVSFTDIGFMPVNALTIGGDPQRFGGKFDGLFIQYSGTGVQHFAANTAPTTADYTTLHYDLVGYKGTATFGHDATGAPTVTGADHLTTLAQGNLIAGQLGFDASGGISGELDATYQVKGEVTGSLKLTVQHSAGDITPALGGFTLDHGTLQATYVPLTVG